MGMAASQARFLGLTARKTNVEYEGQQVNQQRTALSNQSANYYNQLLGMQVPTPPSIQDYTKTVYSFTDGALANTVTSMIAQKDGTYLISYLRSYNDPSAVVATPSSIVTRIEVPEEVSKEVSKEVSEEVSEKNASDDDSDSDTDIDTDIDTDTDTDINTTYRYSVGAIPIRELGSESIDELRDTDPYLKTLSDAQIEALKKEEDEYIEKLNKKYCQGGDGNWQVYYRLDSTSGTYNPVFYRQKVLDNAKYSDTTGASQSFIQAYTTGQERVTEEVKGVQAKFEQDSSGRLINITLINPEDPDDDPVTYPLTTETTTDQAAYTDAMNQYEFDKSTYDKSIKDINAKIEVIQVEDKNLELRLKQLDTEQDAIQTEMDAVQKVIEKNVESTFKTFG